MSAPELKPCPFCGGKPSHNEGGNSRYGRFWWRVGCVNCGVFFNDEEKWDANSHGNLDPECHQKQCFDTWNTRTDTILSDPRVKALVEAATVTLHDIDDLVANSEGVTGLHMNGDVACWESLMDGGAFGAWLSSVEKLRLTLAALKGAANE